MDSRLGEASPKSDTAPAGMTAVTSAPNTNSPGHVAYVQVAPVQYVMPGSSSYSPPGNVVQSVNWKVSGAGMGVTSPSGTWYTTVKSPEVRPVTPLRNVTVMVMGNTLKVPASPQVLAPVRTGRGA